ncbi:MAG: hypothetical protein ACRDZ3_12365, partial [Acidimicrobiia bacterium]
EEHPLVESAAMPAGDVPLAGQGKGNGNGAESDGGPPTEALLVIEDEVVENGRPGPAARRRP